MGWPGVAWGPAAAAAAPLWLAAALWLALSPTGSSALSLSLVASFTGDLLSSRGVNSVLISDCGERDTRFLLRALSKKFRTGTLTQSKHGSRTHVGDGRSVSAVLVIKGSKRNLSFHEDLTFNSSFLWVLPGGTVSDLQDTPMRFDSEVILVGPTEIDAGRRWRFVTAYRENQVEPPAVEEEGFWSLAEGLSIPRQSPILVRRSDLGRVPVKTVLFLNKNVSHEVVTGMTNITKEECLKLISKIAMHTHVSFTHTVARFNMSVRYLTHTQSGELARRPDGTFTGTMGMVDTGAADVMSSGLFFYIGRMSAVEFTIPDVTFRACFVFLAPSAFGSADALIMPLHSLTWGGVAAMCILVAAVDHVIDTLQVQQGDLGSSVLKAIGSLAGQGQTEVSSRSAGRILFLFFQVFCFLVSAYYSSAIVKFLLRPPPSNIKNVKDLVRSPLKGAADNWFHNVRVMTNSTDPLIRLAYDHFVKPPAGRGFLARAEAIAALKNNPVALYGEDTVIYDGASTFSNSEICRLQEVDVEPVVFHAVGVGKRVAFKDYVRAGLLIQKERGISNRETLYWMTSKPVCNLEAVSKNSMTIEIVSLLPALYVFSAGLVLACALLGAERVAHGHGNHHTALVQGSRR